MPYAGEKASPISHVELLSDPLFATRAEKWAIRPDLQDRYPPDGLVVLDADRLGAPGHVDITVAVDGSDLEFELDPGYTAIVTQIGSATIHLDPYLASAGQHGRPVDLEALEASRSTDRLHWWMASSGVRPSGGGSGFELWREETFASFRDARVPLSEVERPSLLDSLMLLHGGPGAPSESVRLAHCPYECSTTPLAVGPEEAICPTCGRILYPTDALRCHEEYETVGSNLVPANRLMLAGERLLILLYIDQLFRDTPDALGRTMFFVDGPLAFYGPSAPMHRRWVRYWSQLSEQVTELPVIVGIEKTGAFVRHAEQIERFLSPRQFVIPDNDYIVSHIRPGRGNGSSERVFGRDEHFGRHVLYKSASGEMIVLSVARRSGAPYGGDDPTDPSEYPQLATALAQIDRVGSSMYDNALFPTVEAHSSAALSLRSRPLFRSFVRSALGLPDQVTPHELREPSVGPRNRR